MPDYAAAWFDLAQARHGIARLAKTDSEDKDYLREKVDAFLKVVDRIVEREADAHADKLPPEAMDHLRKMIEQVTADLQ